MSATKKRKIDDEEVIEIDDNVDPEETQFSKQKCPVCSKLIQTSDLTIHVHFCLQTSKYKQKAVKASEPTASTQSNKPVPTSPKAMFQIFSQKSAASKANEDNQEEVNGLAEAEKRTQPARIKSSAPLAEIMRPSKMEDYFGQTKIAGVNSFIRKIIDNNLEFPSLVLWGPPGTGKTTLANIIETKYKAAQPDKYKFLKMSAALSGINEVKKIFEQAKNFSKYNIKTVLFLDEIHRFNKMQQDILLSHIEKGIITLICATTENPSFSVNAALLSRCRVVRLEKLGSEDVLEILHRALAHLDIVCVDSEEEILTDVERQDGTKQFYLDTKGLQWIADVSDGDARIALGNLELINKLFSPDSKTYLSLADIRDEIKNSHMLYDKTGEEHYNTISALHKSIRASDENAALYWVTRMLVAGDDPRFVCRRLIRAASEDIGLLDPQALILATSTLTAVQTIGMPESDCIIAQCAVYLARAPKSRLIQNAYNTCKRDILECKGALPAVPLRLRNISNPKVFDEADFAEEEGLESCMPSGLEAKNYFVE